MIKRGFNFLIFSHIWISLGAVGLLLGNCMILNIDCNITYFVLIFFTTLFGYSIQYSGSFNLNKLRPMQSYWVDKNKLSIIIIKWSSFFISAILSLIVFNVSQIVLSIPFFLAVLFYKKKTSLLKGLRAFPFLKIFVIALCWSWVCSVLPQISIQSKDLDWVNVLFIFVFIVAITIPFDVRDLNGDSKSLLTIPILLGKNISVLLSIVLVFITMTFFFIDGNLDMVVYLILVNLVLIPTLYTSDEYYYLFIIDGLLVLFPIFAIW
jgi:hypothetical protein